MCHGIRDTSCGMEGNAPRGSSADLARVVVMRLDLDFLRSPKPISGLVIYRYRTGIVLQQMKRCLAELAKADGGMVVSVSADELSMYWTHGGLFPGIRIADISFQRVRSIRKIRRLA